MKTRPFDRDEFLKMIQDNKGIIFKISHTYCHNQNDREDLAQEIVYHLWKSGRGYNPENKFSTWMYRVALNVAISHYRKWKNRSREIPLSEKLFELEDKEDHSMETEEKISQIQLFINELKELDRALMILYLDSKKYSEIAEIIGITETNVATKINRIKERLKQKFEQQHNVI